MRGKQWHAGPDCSPRFGLSAFLLRFAAGNTCLRTRAFDYTRCIFMYARARSTNACMHAGIIIHHSAASKLPTCTGSTSPYVYSLMCAGRTRHTCAKVCDLRYRGDLGLMFNVCGGCMPSIHIHRPSSPLRSIALHIYNSAPNTYIHALSKLFLQLSPFGLYCF